MTYHPGTFIRVLAVLDAIAFPALGLYMATTWPKGGLFATLFATVMVLWGVKRGSRAFFQFEHYRWMVRFVAMFALACAAFGFVRWLLA